MTGDVPDPGDSSGAGDATGTGAPPTAPSDVGSTSPTRDPTDTSAPSSTPDTTDAPPGFVRGQLLDFWGHPVPNIELDVGGVRAVTAADGMFTADDVPEVYDLSLVVHLDEEARETYGWTYQGLTSRRVVLPVYRGLPPRRAKLRIDVPNLEPPIDDRDYPCGALALDGQHGHQAFSIYQKSMPLSVVWRGPTELSLSARGLFWEPRDPGCAVPARFLGWQRQHVNLRPRDESALAFDEVSESRPVTAATLEGTVSLDAATSDGAVEAGRASASLFLRFSDGATIPLGSTDLENGRFSFVAPIVDDASWIVAASHTLDGDYAVHYDRVAPSQAVRVALQPPPSPRLLQPPDRASVRPNEATFEWAASGHVGVLMVTQHEAFTVQFVVTANHSVTLPDLSHLGFTLAAGEPYTWGVEVHAPVSSVDDWLDRPFPLDPFSIDFQSPMGPSQTAGKLARSGGRQVEFN